VTAVGSRTDIPRQQGDGHRAPRPETGAKATVRARVFRPRRMVPATIVAAVIIVVAALTAAGIVAALIGRPIAFLHAGAIGSWLTRTPWSDPVALAIGAVLVVLGLVLVLIALVPGKAKVVGLDTGRPDVLMALTRRGLRHVAATSAGNVDGAEHARATARGRRVRVTVTTPLRDRAEAEATRERATAAVTEALDRLDLTRPVTVKVRVRKSR